MANSNDTLIEQILSLKKERNAIILSHNYQLGEVQDIADFVGDSLELSQQAAKTDADVIVFCGVHFMAETASIISPDKTVLLPDLHAGCPMADMITPQRLREKKKEHPRAVVVCYINSSAAVKAESDICCTSANAVRIVEQVPPDKEILFVPDQYLGSFVASKTGRELILWPGYCPTHARIQAQDISRLRAEYPQAKVIVHPECRSEVAALADAVLSTGGMIRFARESGAKEIIIGTEIGILHRLRKENPGKKFIPVSEQAVCPRMKLITLENILWSLESMEHQVKVPEKIRLKAKLAVDRMLAG
ncbi:MAG: quinolinate synthase [Chloroflexi bacterium RBG_16_50_9]|nr:MAG: quinolinate synthase [Chloroflexi bacterium RBG_16_50_9]